jgi:hypothetical protein
MVDGTGGKAKRCHRLHLQKGLHPLRQFSLDRRQAKALGVSRATVYVLPGSIPGP